MTSTTRRRLLCACVASVALLAPAAAAADDVVADLQRDTPIAAYGGALAWSGYDTASRRYRLVIRQGDRTAPAPIAGSRRAFDVSLGPDARGRVVALYTRCRSATRGCDVYRYDVRGRRERRVESVSSPRHDEAWPVQWGDRVAFVRRARAYGLQGDDYEVRPDPRGKRGGGRLVACDIPYVKTGPAGRPSRRLDRGLCATTTGMSIRGARIVQVTDVDQGGAGSETQVRELRARGGAVRVLARAAGGEGGYSPFASPSQSASAVWLTRIGNREPMSFLRIDLRSRRMTAVDPHVPLAGRVARDERGTVWYVQAPEPPYEFHGEPPFCVSPIEPCRLVRASADPFSAATRALVARFSVPPRPQTAIITGPLVLSGGLSRTIVRAGRLVRREPLAAVALELLRSERADGRGRFVATGLVATTDAAGRWSLVVSRPPSSGIYAVHARAIATSSPAWSAAVSAKLTLAAGGGSLSGTVAPAQPGRAVTLQRLDADGLGALPNGQVRCQNPNATGEKSCVEEAWITIASPMLDSDGTAFAAAVGRPGIYRAVLAADPNAFSVRANPNIYGGLSPQVRVAA